MTQELTSYNSSESGVGSKSNTTNNTSISATENNEITSTTTATATANSNAAETTTSDAVVGVSNIGIEKRDFSSVKSPAVLQKGGESGADKNNNSIQVTLVEAANGNMNAGNGDHQQPAGSAAVDSTNEPLPGHDSTPRTSEHYTSSNPVAESSANNNATTSSNITSITSTTVKSESAGASGGNSNTEGQERMLMNDLPRESDTQGTVSAGEDSVRSSKNNSETKAKKGRKSHKKEKKSKKKSRNKSSSKVEDGGNSNAEETRCVCGFTHDDGFMICCDKCLVWQHIDCVDVSRNNVPANYFCELCQPRYIDVDKAKALQTRKRLHMDSDDDMDSESESALSDSRKASWKQSSEAFAETKDDQYEYIDESVYNNEIRDIVSERRASANALSFTDLQSLEGERKRMFSPKYIGLQNVDVNGKQGLFAEENIKGGYLITFFRGTFRKKSSLRGKEALTPFIYFHNSLDLCCDASKKGNDARYLRQSCTPNAEVRDIYIGGRLCLGIFALRDISEDSEITIELNYLLKNKKTIRSCACGKVNCQAFLSRSHKSGANTSDDAMDIDDQSFLKKRKRELSRSENNPASTAQESQDDRESRKMRAILQAIEKMENKKENRRKSDGKESRGSSGSPRRRGDNRSASRNLSECSDISASSSRSCTPIKKRFSEQSKQPEPEVAITVDTYTYGKKALLKQFLVPQDTAPKVDKPVVEIKKEAPTPMDVDDESPAICETNPEVNESKPEEPKVARKEDIAVREIKMADATIPIETVTKPDVAGETKVPAHVIIKRELKDNEEPVPVPKPTESQDTKGAEVVKSSIEEKPTPIVESESIPAAAENTKSQVEEAKEVDSLKTEAIAKEASENAIVEPAVEEQSGNGEEDSAPGAANANESDDREPLRKKVSLSDYKKKKRKTVSELDVMPAPGPVSSAPSVGNAVRDNAPKVSLATSSSKSPTTGSTYTSSSVDYNGSRSVSQETSRYYREADNSSYDYSKTLKPSSGGGRSPPYGAGEDRVGRDQAMGSYERSRGTWSSSRGSEAGGQSVRGERAAMDVSQYDASGRGRYASSRGGSSGQGPQSRDFYYDSESGFKKTQNIPGGSGRVDYDGRHPSSSSYGSYSSQRYSGPVDRYSSGSSSRYTSSSQDPSARYGGEKYASSASGTSGGYSSSKSSGGYPPSSSSYHGDYGLQYGTGSSSNRGEPHSGSSRSGYYKQSSRDESSNRMRR
eukprot:Nk52_evm1s136 gene=Nk52_evmTU1s136